MVRVAKEEAETPSPVHLLTVFLEELTDSLEGKEPEVIAAS